VTIAGLYRYVVWDKIEAYLAQGWEIAAFLGPWSVLMQAPCQGEAMSTPFEDFIRKRDAAFNDLTPENAAAFAKSQGIMTAPLIALASLHKARLQWLHATNAQFKESLAWLEEHGCAPTFRDIPPLTPDTRDAQRRALRLGPLDMEGESD
jgi:hypothetical protein